ncbi:hypothetical protein FYK55_01190 [Roseiconus nitratireducens]|uniref:Uncharacterized protein n=1 Tax=Roseiconus nitratireducens TaxID=2605748 RepID=A0A5M6DLD4_9BACT|nr:hypothetical protein [Roseiconus nitratireducens]KAA5547062.1 hypothetical protein FYK55_01190 [Roseiconus nitratireducens]
MKVISLNCNHCGAPLEVPKKARFVTCGFCESKLAIEHSGNTYSTAVIEELQETTQQLARDVARIKSSSDIERLDAQWERKREQHMITGKHGAKSLPSKGGAIAAAVFMGGFGLFWTVFAFSITRGASSVGAPGAVNIFPLFGLLFVGFAIFAAVSQFSKAEAYERDLKRYQSERRRLVNDMQESD